MHPKKLGRYELVAVLGKGAMGVVYEGRDPNLDRRVAIKTIMVDDLARDAAAEYEARFRTEARSAARLQHPNIVTVYDSDRDGDTAFLVMEYVQGEDLKRHLDRGERFEVAETLRLVQDLLAALDFAHAQGIVHRDIKPANLLIEPGGRLKLTDFGVARITGEATRTQGSMIGTLKYMAPEQVQGQKVDARADQFSAAVVAYQLLTGTRPFDGDNDFSIIHQIIGLDPPPPSSVAQGLPFAVDAVMAQGMAKQREHRFGTCGEFQAALVAAFASGGIAPAAPAPLRAIPAASGSVRPAPTTPGMTAGGTPITQELELEYWRDVRDSTDSRELQGFLQRFPQGIYADLARRRLERLAATDPDPDRTVLQGLTRPPASQPDPAPTQADPVASGPLASPNPVDVAQAPLQQAAGTASREEPPAPAPQSAAAPRGRPAWLMPAALVLVAGIGAATWLAQRPPATDAAATAPVDAPAESPSLPPASSAPVSPSTTTSGVAPTANGSAQAAGDATAAAVTKPAAPQPAAKRPAAPPAATALPRPAQAAPTEDRRPATPAPASPSAPPVAAAPPQPAAPAGVAQAVSPDQTCKDKMFLIKQLCLREECAKPGQQQFQVCVKMREYDRMREDNRRTN